MDPGPPVEVGFQDVSQTSRIVGVTEAEPGDSGRRWVRPGRKSGPGLDLVRDSTGRRTRIRESTSVTYTSRTTYARDWGRGREGTKLLFLLFLKYKCRTT